jgi:hypothetical protein
LEHDAAGAITLTSHWNDAIRPRIIDWFQISQAQLG